MKKYLVLLLLIPFLLGGKAVDPRLVETAELVSITMEVNKLNMGAASIDELYVVSIVKKYKLLGATGNFLAFKTVSVNINPSSIKISEPDEADILTTLSVAFKESVNTDKESITGIKP